MNPTQAVCKLKEIYAKAANPAIAIGMKAYMKGLFPFYGIKKPIRAALTKDLMKEIVSDKEIDSEALIKDLWKEQEREFHYFAMELALKKKLYLKKESLELFEFMILNQSWWDSVDFIAAHHVGKYMTQFPEQKEKEIMRFINHPNMWMNRTAMIFQLFYKEKTDTDLLLASILTHIDSKEFFHRKAMGWALRQYSKTDANFVIQTINAHKFSGLTEREAMKLVR
jgi:3-methyladenine DNA glycosylase AlkD